MDKWIDRLLHNENDTRVRELKPNVNFKCSMLFWFIVALDVIQPQTLHGCLGLFHTD